VICILLPCTDW